MKQILFLLVVILFFYSCSRDSQCVKISVDRHMLDSAKAKSDTSYTKKYRSEDFFTAEYYINKKDTTVCQVMKDSLGTIRQVIMANKIARFYTAEYYSNGQLKGRLSLDENGKPNGEAIYYYEGGCIKSTGKFNHGLYSGKWNNYSEKGEITLDEYDDNGQLIKTGKP